MARAEPNFIMMAEEEEPSPVNQLRRRALRLLQAADEAPGEPLKRPQTGFAAPAALGPVEPEPARALAVGIVTMPAVFIVVVMGALALFGKPASEPKAARAAGNFDRLEQPASQSATGATLASSKTGPSIALGEDRRVTSISLDGDLVAMHVESPMGSEIVVYDYVAERVVASAPIVSASIKTEDQLAAITGAPPRVASLAVIAPAIDEVVETRGANGPLPPEIKPRAAE